MLHHRFDVNFLNLFQLSASQYLSGLLTIYMYIGIYMDHRLPSSHVYGNKLVGEHPMGTCLLLGELKAIIDFGSQHCGKVCQV